MGSDAVERWFPGLTRRLGDWAQWRAGAEASDAVRVEVPAEVALGLARVWSNPELLADLAVARWTVLWLGLLLAAGFRAVAPGSGASARPSWPGTVFGEGVTTAASRATLPELIGDLSQVLPGLERGLPWPAGGGVAAAEATLTELVRRAGSGYCGQRCELLMELVRRRPEHRLSRFGELAAARLGPAGASPEPVTPSLVATLGRLLASGAPPPGSPDPAGVATLHAMRIWVELEWEAGLARERGGSVVSLNWRLEVARRASTLADQAVRFARGRDAQLAEVAAAWRQQTAEDLRDALFFADPEPGPEWRAHADGGQVIASWFRACVHRPRAPRWTGSASPVLQHL